MINLMAVSYYLLYKTVMNYRIKICVFGGKIF